MVAHLLVGRTLLVVNALLFLRVGNDVGPLLHERPRLLTDGLVQILVHPFLLLQGLMPEVVLLLCRLALTVPGQLVVDGFLFYFRTMAGFAELRLHLLPDAQGSAALVALR